jgi:hypothetical protein
MEMITRLPAMAIHLRVSSRRLPIGAIFGIGLFSATSTMVMTHGCPMQTALSALFAAPEDRKTGFVFSGSRHEGTAT